MKDINSHAPVLRAAQNVLRHVLCQVLEPMLHSTVDYHLEHLLRKNVPEERIETYSSHSFRIGSACALLAANCPYDMIQALARWRSDKSVSGTRAGSRGRATESAGRK